MVNKFTINNNILLIVNILSQGRTHIRKIAVTAGLNHVTVINSIKILEKLKIVSFETLGRNKEYFLLNNKPSRIYQKIAKEHAKL